MKPSAYYNENDPKAAGWLRNLIAAGHIAPGDVDERSIADVRPGDLEGYVQCHFFAGIGGWSHALRLAGWDDARPVWTGSCPCQPFSAAGGRKGFDDARHLWPVFRDLIAERRPATVFGEQVAAASGWLRLVRSDLEAMDYAVGCLPIEAASAGADHLRDRFWFVADHLGDDGGARLALRPLTEVERGDVRHEGAAVAPSGDRGVALADTDQSGAGEERQQRSGQQRGVGGDPQARDSLVADAARERQQRRRGRDNRRQPEPADDGDVAVTDSEGQQRQPEHGEVAGPRGGVNGSLPDGASEQVGSAGQPREHGGMDWVMGADGKARRVKSGIRLLAHGFPGRVGLLRGFGNAIDPRPAAAFIGAYLDV